MSEDFPFDASRFKKFLPYNGDRDLILLKGHLLVEELLRTYIKKMLPQPDELSDPREFGFIQYLRLTKAFQEDASHDWIWVALEKLNSIRNLLAHHLEPKGFEDRLEHFLSFVEENAAGKRTEEELKKMRMERLYWIMSLLLLLLTGILAVKLHPVFDQENET